MRMALNGLAKRRTNSAVLESAEYPVNATSVRSPEEAVCALAASAIIAPNNQLAPRLRRGEGRAG